MVGIFKVVGYVHLEFVKFPPKYLRFSFYDGFTKLSNEDLYNSHQNIYDFLFYDGFTKLSNEDLWSGEGFDCNVIVNVCICIYKGDRKASVSVFGADVKWGVHRDSTELPRAHSSLARGIH